MESPHDILARFATMNPNGLACPGLPRRSPEGEGGFMESPHDLPSRLGTMNLKGLAMLLSAS